VKCGSEAQEGRARQHGLVAGEEKAVERRLFFGSPWWDRKVLNRAVGERETPGALRGVQCRLARDGVGEPSMRSGGETVERVRNPEDGRFRAVVEATGTDGRQASSSAEGERNPRRGAAALRVRLRL